MRNAIRPGIASPIRPAGWPLVACAATAVILSQPGGLAAQAAAIRQSSAITPCDTLRGGDTRKQYCERTVRQDSMRRDSVSKSALIRVSLEQIVDTQWSGALQTLRWISRLDSSFRNVQRESSLTWASQGRYDRLIELGRPDSALDPHTARVIGYAWEQRGMPERAAEYYAAMATQMPNEPRAQVVYGRALADAKRLTEAIRVFARATDSLKSDADVRATAWLEMAKASVQLGKPATANAYLERARCAHPPVAESEEWQSVRLSARRNSGLDTLAKYRRQAANTAAPGLSSDAAAPCPRR